jgi:hypothetical protein
MWLLSGITERRQLADWDPMTTFFRNHPTSTIS